MRAGKWTTVLVTSLALGGGLALTGCDLLKSGSKGTSDEDTDIRAESRKRAHDDDGDEAPAEEPTAEATAKAAAGKVAAYVDMVSVRGHARLLKAFNIYQAADVTSERFVEYPKDRYVDLRQQYGDWLMVDWVNDAGDTQQGWIQAKLTDSNLKVEALPAADDGATAKAKSASKVSSAASASASAVASAAPVSSAVPSALASALRKVPKLRLKFPPKGPGPLKLKKIPKLQRR